MPSDIADWTQVASIDLTSNPLECDCKLLWLKDLLSSIEAEEEAEAVANRCVFMRFSAMMKKSVTTIFSLKFSSFEKVMFASLSSVEI